MTDPGNRLPPDQDVRDVIRSDLDKTLLVEAAAGTGKTTSMVGRMTALLAQGRCAVHTLAAVTFTRKAAAELRARFQVELERAARGSEPGTVESARLAAALAGIDGCPIGTIHSFCARLLRERPVEAGVAVDFVKIEPGDDLQLRKEAWEETAARLIADDDPIVDELRSLGLEVRDLAHSFERFANFPDVDEWPAPRRSLSDPSRIGKALDDEVRHMESLIPTFPPDRGTDKLMPRYRLVARLARQNDLDDRADLIEVLKACRKAKATQKCWPGGNSQARAEQKRWDTFRTEVVDPYLKEYRIECYESILRLYARACAVYDNLRRSAGVLNYQDILLKTAGLLRRGAHVRRYFRRRLSHLLVDEFQDTDPIQAEIMLLLTADDPAEIDWTRCRPVPGALFVVGDPKQSIYRFRRADIVTYNTVKDIIAQSGGRVVSLSTNFRTTSTIVDWANTVFDSEFPDAADDYSPCHVALEPWRAACDEDALGGVRVLEVPETHGTNDEAIRFESELLARTIRGMVDERRALPDAHADGGERPVTFGDILIITATTKHLGLYARALQNLAIPHQVTGGVGMNEVDELRLLHLCLAALDDPHDPVALVAVLRSELFGISDRTLHAFGDGGGRFCFLTTVPGQLGSDDRESMTGAFEKLGIAHRWLAKLPPAAAAEKIARSFGLLPRACAAEGGDVQAGSLSKAIEILRAAQARSWSAAEMIDHLARILECQEPHDGISLRSETEPPVRLMNLHKAKGLEAPVVFLADPTGSFSHGVESHIDRSGSKVLGHLAVRAAPRGPNPAGDLLARPDRWEEYERRERQFLGAEKTRLMYVAATRAGVQLTIVRRVKNNRYNSWQFFERHLVDLPRLEDPGPRAAPIVGSVPVTSENVTDAVRAIEERWTAARTPSFDVQAASRASETARPFLSGAETVADEDGARKGTVVHSLLEIAMADPTADLESLASSLVVEQELDRTFSRDALSLVDSVIRSPLWRRATSSELFLTEVPVHVDLAGDGVQRPEIVKGVIDLVFKEEDGWVIVDYKTDDRPQRALADLVDKYRPQIDLYRRAWERAVETRVKEAGVYFVRTNRYETV